MVREFQSVIGRETRDQAAELGIDVEALVACVGGGSNAVGFFAPFIDEEKPRLIGVEAGGRGRGIGEHAARMTGEAATGIVQGYKSKFLLDSDGQVQHTHSISAGLDYPGIGPQLAHLGETRRVEFHSATDAQALAALKLLARNEGVIFALESAHGAAYGLELAASLPPGKNVIINMSGRGDKDIFITAKAIQPGPWADFMEREIGEIRASQGQDRANRMPASGSKEQGADE
jgi:tryptophan synthase beta chain